jgi:molybdate transport system substrate-binding protein
MTIIRVMSGGAPRPVLAQLTPRFEQLSGDRIDFSYAVMSALRDRLAGGEKTDVLVMPLPMLEGYANDGLVRAGSRVTFGIVGIGVAVREGAPLPDVSSKEKFRAAMLAARTVVHATPGKTPSGTHMGKVMDALGLTEAMAGRIVHKPALEGGVQMVVAGDADIGIYPASEVAGVKGLIVAGRLPAEIDLQIVYGAAVTADSAAGEVAADFVTFLAAPENRAVWQAAGFQPL